MKEILGIGESLAGKLMVYDAFVTRLYVMSLPWDPEDPLNGRDASIEEETFGRENSPNGCLWLPV